MPHLGRYRQCVAGEPFDVVIPLELEAGVYAEALAGWFTANGIVLDFVAPGDGSDRLVTARVRVPATAVFDLRQALDGVIQEYELEYGEIRRPRRRGDG